MSEVQIRVHRSEEELDGIFERWEELFDRIHCPDVNLAPTWYRSWFRTFSPGRIHVMSGWRGDELIGVLPMVVKRQRLLKVLPVTCLHSATNPHSPSFDAICAPDDGEDFVDAIRKHLFDAGCSGSFDMIQFERVPDDAALAGPLEAWRDKTDCAHERVAWNGSYYLPIEGEFESYWRTLRKSFRRNRNNMNNRLAKEGEVSFDVETDANAEAIRRFLEIEATGWKLERGSPIGSSANLVEFYTSLAEGLAARGRFALAFLSLDGAPIAATFGAVVNQTFHFLKVAVDYDQPKEILDRYSPGQALLYHLIRWCHDERLTAFDFSGPFYDYERHWCRHTRQKHHHVIFNRRSPVARLYLRLRTLKP